MNEKNTNTDKEIKPLKNHRSTMFLRILFFSLGGVGLLFSLFIFFQWRSPKEIGDADNKILEQNLTTLEEKIENLESKLNSVSTLVQNKPRSEDGINEIEQRVKELENWRESIQLNFEDYKQIQPSLLKLKNNVENGHPYKTTLAALKDLKLPPEAHQYLGVLENYQELGIPAPLLLKESLPEALNEWTSENSTIQTDNFVKKMWFKFKSLIQIRKTEGFQETDTSFEANMAKVEKYARAGNFSSALEILNKEQKPLTPKIKMWIEHAEAYVKSREALTNLEGLLQTTIISRISSGYDTQRETSHVS